MSTVESPYTSKQRISSVDMTRVIAAMALMTCHLSANHGGNLTHIVAGYLDMGIAPVDAIFFVFSGYFSCRALTWRKACVNAWWCSVAYVVWNFIAYVADCVANPSMLEELSWQGVVVMLGFGQLLPGNVGAAPIDGPLWYMRDLILLFLLSPILFRFIRYIFPILLFCLISPKTTGFIYHNTESVLSWYSILFFSVGAYLRSMDRKLQLASLQFYSRKLVIIYWSLVTLLWAVDFLAGLGIISFNRSSGVSNSGYTGVIFYLLSFCMLYQTVRWVEVCCPRLAEWSQKLAPVTFLTYASHWIIWKHLPSSIIDSKWAVLLPIAVFAAMTLLFFALKRWCRSLLRPIAYYKLRSSDYAGMEKPMA